MATDLDPINRLANRMLENTAAQNRAATAMERSADSVNLLRQAIDRREAAADERERAWIDALLKVNERLALLDRGVQQVDHGVDEVREKTGKFPLAEMRKTPTSVRPQAYFAFYGWRIPLDGALWKFLRFAIPLAGGSGIGALIHHLLSHGGTP
jgi:hypothetical protein